MNPAFEKPSDGAGEQSVSPGELYTPHHPTSHPRTFSPNHGHSPAQSPPPMTYTNQQYVSPQQSTPAAYFPQQQQQQQQQQPQMHRPPPQQYRKATPIGSLSTSPAPVDCPRCGQHAMTVISHHAGKTTHAWAAGLCCLTCLLCFIPYLMNGLKDVQHRCSQCGTLLGTWHKGGTVDVHAHA